MPSDLAKLTGFDPRLDNAPDLMHIFLVDIKAKCYALDHVVGKLNINRNLERQFLKALRSKLPGSIVAGRRFSRSLEAASICSMTAEETLVIVRLVWRPLFSLWKRELAGQTRTVWHDVFDMMAVTFEKLEALTLHLLQGTNASTSNKDRFDAGVELAVDYFSHIQSAKVQGKHVFAPGYCTFTTHLMLHVPMYELRWGMLAESWCHPVYLKLDRNLTLVLSGALCLSVLLGTLQKF